MKKMGKFNDKVKEKAKDVKDTVVDKAKALSSIDILTQKFALELNAALEMEHAVVKRLQARIEEVSYPRSSNKCSTTFKKAESTKKVCNSLYLSCMRAQSRRIGLPLQSYPQAMLEMMRNTMTRQGLEFKWAEEDLILENAEVIRYFMMM